MLIKKIKLSNFKCFDEVEVDLSDFNVLVGANASGKSNFLQAFKFLKDIQVYGLENAVSLQGGMEYLKNIRSDRENKVKILVQFLTNRVLYMNPVQGNNNIIISLVCTKVFYKMELLQSSDSEFQVDEEIEFCINAVEDSLDNGGKINLGVYTASIKRSGGQVNFDFLKDSLKLKLSDGKEINIDANQVNPIGPINSSNPFHITGLLVEFYETILPFSTHQYSIYDFNVKSAKSLSAVVGKAELEESGENLILVLNKIFKSSTQKRTFINLISLPYTFYQ